MLLNNDARFRLFSTEIELEIQEWYQWSCNPSLCSNSMSSFFTGLKYLRRLNLDRIVTCRLNPLKVRLSWFCFCLFTIRQPRKYKKNSVHLCLSQVLCNEEKMSYTNSQPPSFLQSTTGVNDTAFAFVKSYYFKDCAFSSFSQVCLPTVVKMFAHITRYSDGFFW